jgi:hypothetical protein
MRYVPVQVLAKGCNVEEIQAREKDRYKEPQ